MTKMPKTSGYYWAKWKIATDETFEGEELTPSSTWEIVQVNRNLINAETMHLGEAGYSERFSVSVCGVRETQWPDCFVWGDFVADLDRGR